MNEYKFPLISADQQKEVYDALHYMKMAELKKACQVLSISDSGNKGELISRIMVYVKTGEIEPLKTIPAKSLAKNHPIQELNKKSLMLYGSYKNDLKTRNFFKSLIGPQFHYTAFGIDWLNERWLNGNPPTYQEFADYWIEENAKRNKQKAEPKKVAKKTKVEAKIA